MQRFYFVANTLLLDGHLHLDSLVRLVANHFKVVVSEIINVLFCRIDLDLGEGAGHALELLLQCINMVGINMSIANGVDKVASLKAAYLSDHMSQESIRCDVERNAQAHVGTALIHLTGQLALVRVDVKLAEHVTGRQGHLVEISWVPGRHDDAAVLGVVLDLINALGKLVDALSGVIGVHRFVLGPKVTPLEAIDRPEVTDLAVAETTVVEEFAAAIAVPDVDILGGKVIGIGIARDEPNKLFGDTAPKRAFGSKKGKSIITKAEAHLSAKLGKRPSAGAVTTADPILNDITAHL
mmetsp:Transcript_2869/g.6583  ORF Transcript_2869/g.6583 Transcript_2869/m.6583 type:complete len:296 (-) Transcript_2869:912-1799(-)